MNPDLNTVNGTEYRRMRAEDAIPEGLRANALAPDPQWTWVVVRDGRIVAGLFGGYYQGMLFIGTVNALPEAGIFWVRGLFREVAADCWQRGVRSYLTFLDDGATCAKLKKAYGRSIVHQEAFKGNVTAGLLDRWI